MSVECDMATAGGGWTIVFFPADANVMAIPVSYTTSTPQLLADAQTVLLAYRTSADVVTSNFATFDLPVAWQNDTPFDYASSDLMTGVSINGGPTTATMVRFGYQNFSYTCNDPWAASGGSFGRICIVGTTAPFYNGFASPYVDMCSDSLSPWNAVACAADIRFSIAVR